MGQFYAAIAGVALLLAPGVAHAQLYLSGDLGAASAAGPVMEGHDNDRGGVCDEFINPLFADVPGCTTPQRRGDSWTSDFGSAGGVLGGLAAGYGLADRFSSGPLGRLRLEAEYFYRSSAFNQAVGISFGSGDSAFAANRAGEVVLTEDRVDTMAGHNVFGNLYLDFASGGRFTPYVGVGIGVGFTEAGYGALGLLNNDPARIASAAGLPNEDEVRRNLAGTVVSEQATLSDRVAGYQLLFGMDYALTEQTSFGLKGRWVRFEEFSDGGAWDRLRSHESQLRLDGSEPVAYEIKLDDLALFGISLALKYRP